MITSHHIKRLLEEKHSEDLFVSECKDGPTHSGSHLRLDAWVMSRSWANMLFTGYEIKVSRRDFLSDQKWPNYLPYCNKFFFVAPNDKVISPEELPPDVGLILVSKGGNKLLTKKHATLRNIETPVTLLLYVLMCRSNISKFELGDPTSSLNYWRRWLSEKEEGREIGYNVSRGLRQKYEKDVLRERTRLDSMQRDIEKNKLIEKVLDSMGVNISYWERDEESIREKIREATEIFTKKRVGVLKSARDMLTDALSEIEKTLKGESK